MAAFKALIFDLGKVVFDLSFDKVFQSRVTLSSRNWKEIKSQFKFDQLFDEFEKNEVSEVAFRVAVSKRLNLKLTDEEFDEAWCGLYLAIYDGINTLLIQLKNDYRLVVLTNTNAIHSRIWRVKYAATLCHFEEVFSSHETETRKPESKSHQIILDYLKCKPAEVLFLDDNLVNIQGAAKLGIAAILVTSTAQTILELRKLGVLK